MSALRRKPVQREKHEQQHIVDLLRSIGSDVYVFGTRRSAGRACPNCGTFVPEDQGTRQTPGWADVAAFVPVPTGRRRDKRKVLLFVEAKAAGGRLSPEQRQFRANCLETVAAVHTLDEAFLEVLAAHPPVRAVYHVVGGQNDVIAWLLSVGACRESQFAHYRLPQTTAAVQP
jgi:hypothetical protein